jgi:hypothetical protein
MTVFGRAQMRLLDRVLFASACAVVAIATAGTQGAYGATPACSVSWKGGASNNLWTTPGNWSTGKVPGPTSDVCISQFVIVVGPKQITVHSLQLGEEASVDFGEQASTEVNITDALLNQGNFLIDGTLSAGAIVNPGGIESQGESTIVSRSFSSPGTVAAIDGTLRVPDAPVQLQKGNLSGGSWDDYRSVLVLPEAIRHISGGTVGVSGEAAALTDFAGNNALAPLQSIGARAVLAASGDGSLQVSGNLVSRGTVELGGYAEAGTLAIGGTYTQAPGAVSSIAGGTLSAGAVTISQGSRLEGTGTIAASVTNSGTLEPTGELALSGDYTQDANGVLAQYPGTTLSVAAKATLAGALSIKVNDPCPPSVGSSFTAMTYGSRSGMFTSHTAGFGLRVAAHEIIATFEGPSALAAAC